MSIDPIIKAKLMPCNFEALAQLGETLEGTKRRLVMTDSVAKFLELLGPDEVEPAVSMLLGRAFPKWSPQTLDVSWATLSDIIIDITGAECSEFGKAFHESGDAGSAAKVVFQKSCMKRQSMLFKKDLTVLEVRRNLQAIADAEGTQSRQRKKRLVTALLSQSSPLEAKYLVKILIGEMRTGFHEGLMDQAVSKAFHVPLKSVQEATMLVGDVGEVASIVRAEGERGLAKVGFKVFRPVNPMLASVADGVEEALQIEGGVSAFEFKYDGARVQIHVSGHIVKIFSRRLTDVTDSLPEIVEVVKNNVVSKEAILEGEVIAIDALGSPIPFQHLMRRFRRVYSVSDMVDKVLVKLFLFDILYLDGRSLISQTYEKRRELLAQHVGKLPLTAQLVTGSVDEAKRFLDQAMSEGHEGLMAKRLNSPYVPGIRGKHWLKIKPTLEPLDLVIVAAEYGYGRRHGWLSDYYLAAKNEKTGDFSVVGKTFKGLTDNEIIEMTRRLRELTIKKENGRVVVLPKIVVEVAYNEIQDSPKYECGMALRFARIIRVRDDKPPKEADTLEKVRDIYERQFLKKGRYKTA